MTNTPSKDLNFRQYIVTVKNFGDLEEFYADMEDASNCNFTPTRPVACLDRRANSRNTHYWLTADEAARLQQDPRVESVILDPTLLGLTDSLMWAQQDSNVLIFDKTMSTSSSLACNWALLRCTHAQNLIVDGRKWGVGGVGAVSSSLCLAPTGQNVDVVVVDFGIPDPAHPEYAVNADGTGGSRLNYVNWTSGTVADYPHTPTTGLSAESWHAWHVTGIAAGNRQGWARDANIYAASLSVSPHVFDNVRNWHASKPVNPSTGRRNPTIVNMSIGSSITYSMPGSTAVGWNRNRLSRVFYRGNFYYPPFTDQQLVTWGMVPGKPWPVINPGWVADLQDAFADGMVVVAAAGNESWRIDTPHGPDWNNFATYYGYDFYISRGSTPGRMGNTDPAQPICVGALSADSNETRAYYSNYGPGIDIFAPGTNINSSVPRTRGSADLRNSNYGLAYSQGTSMACPQVTGILACLMQQYPHWDQQQARSYLAETASNNSIAEVASSGDYYQLNSSPNKIVFFNSQYETEIVVPNVSITASSPSVIEGSSSITFTMELDSVSDTPITVNYVLEGTAVQGTDYLPDAGLQSWGVFSAGQHRSVLAITALPDAVIEGNETISVRILAGQGYNISSSSQAQVTLVDYIPVKPRVGISCSPNQVNESSRTGITYTITRTPTSVLPLEVMFNLQGSATFGVDYVCETVVNQGPNKITIPANQRTATFICRPVPDLINETAESILAVVLPSSNYIIQNASAAATITNVYVPPPAVKISVSSRSMLESTTTTLLFRVGRTGQTTIPLKVNYILSGTATPGQDYTGITGARGNVTIPIGQSFVDIPVTVINDGIRESNETITVSLSNGLGYIVGSPGFATFTIINDD